MVQEVFPDTGAAKAGVAKDDVIVRWNDQEVSDVEQLKAQLSKASAGDKVNLTVLRGGQKVEIKDLVLDAAAPAAKEEAPKAVARKPGKLGIVAYQAADDVFMVKTVNPGGAAEKAGLQPGDIFFKAAGKDVRTFEDLAGVLQGLFAGDTLIVDLKRIGFVPKATRDQDTAIVVQSVNPGSPGEKAGLAVGDVIVKAGDRDTPHFGELAKAVAGVPQGEKLALKVKRGSEEKDLTVDLEDKKITVTLGE